MHEHTSGQVRRLTLEQKWVFKCECARCKDGKQDELLVQRGGTGAQEEEKGVGEAGGSSGVAVVEGESITLSGESGTLSWELKDLSDDLEQW
eukprot:1577560-Rhodomonas_salina.1